MVQSTSTNLRPGKIDFALACPQAKVSHDVFVLPPDKFDVQDGKLQLNQTAKPPWKQQHRLKLLQNLHGLKDAGATWFNHLRKGLIEDSKFKQSLVDPCLFCRGQVILVIHVDDCLIFTPKKSEADNLIQELEDKFTIEDEGDVSGYLGINITRPTEGTIKMNQPALTK